MIVVADTSPLNYLVITGYDHLLPELFGTILVPPAVFEELNDPNAPEPAAGGSALYRSGFKFGPPSASFQQLRISVRGRPRESRSLKRWRPI
jgi:hypothetical protein